MSPNLAISELTASGTRAMSRNRVNSDGMPIVEFTPDAPDLYLAVMHAGVVMAPVVSRLATEEIVAGKEADALAPCRVSRFG